VISQPSTVAPTSTASDRTSAQPRDSALLMSIVV
jgi:hypothetical protein